MRIAFYGDSLTAGIPGASCFRLLKEKYPQHMLLNYGEGDDTAFSLHRRIVRRGLLQPVDLAFVWVGTNDVPFKPSRAASFAKRLLGKPWARTPDEFRDQYRALIEQLVPITPRLVAVSPMLIGEAPDNPHNRYLEQLAAIICETAADTPNAIYLDLRAPAVAALDGSRSSYLPRSVIRTLLDVLASRSDAPIDRLSAQRGLCLTLDGVHLNHRGARLVADQFAAEIDRLAAGDGMYPVM